MSGVGGAVRGASSQWPPQSSVPPRGRVCTGRVCARVLGHCSARLRIPTGGGGGGHLFFFSSRCATGRPSPKSAQCPAAEPNRVRSERQGSQTEERTQHRQRRGTKERHLSGVVANVSIVLVIWTSGAIATGAQLFLSASASPTKSSQSERGDTGRTVAQSGQQRRTAHPHPHRAPCEQTAAE